MNTKTPKQKLMQIKVDPKKDLEDFYHDVINDSDLFKQHRCGYWLYGVERLAKGYLVWVDLEASTNKPSEKQCKLALAAVKSRKKLPTNFYVLDKSFAKRAWIEGVKEWGERWYQSNNTDSDSYDYVVQCAIFGEQKFG